jgi:hypothetical protein
VLFDRLRYDFKKDGRRIDQLHDSDGLDVMLDDEESADTRQEKSLLKLLFHLIG